MLICKVTMLQLPHVNTTLKCTAHTQGQFTTKNELHDDIKTLEELGNIYRTTREHSLLTRDRVIGIIGAPEGGNAKQDLFYNFNCVKHDDPLLLVPPRYKSADDEGT